ncbi:MAG: radical SAM protein [Halanaerobiales bacterium]
MEAFSISDIYVDIDGDKMIDINPLAKNCCNFDCVFCPFGKTDLKTKIRHHFPDTKDLIKRLDKFLMRNKIDKVFINPEGEALYNTELPIIIELIKSYGVSIKILSNGYIFSKTEYFNILKDLDEVVGELVVVNQKDFEKLQDPITGFTIENYINSLTKFGKNFEGKFIITVNILKNYNDSNNQLKEMKNVLKRINPDTIYLETQNEDMFKDHFSVSKDKLKEVKKIFSYFDCRIID